MNSNASRYGYAVACRTHAHDAVGSMDLVAITTSDNEAAEPFGRSGAGTLKIARTSGASRASTPDAIVSTNPASLR